jgi:Collagen triple helix repeat (20 copies)
MNFKDITLSDVSVETKVETLGIALDKKVTELEQTISTVESVVGPQGAKGDKGDQGLPGIDGKDGLDGQNGRDGINGADGADGEDGLGVADVEVDLDGRLLVTLSDGTTRKSSKEVVGPQGPRGIPGATGAAGTGGSGSVGNLDGGFANSNYGGITAIDAGYA